MSWIPLAVRSMGPRYLGLLKAFGPLALAALAAGCLALTHSLFAAQRGG